MMIELSNLTFTEQDDIIPESGAAQILNTGIANTLAGDDIIIGTSPNLDYGDLGIQNYTGIINTGDGNDTLVGTAIEGLLGYGIVNETYSNGPGGTINTGAGKDTIIARASYHAIYNLNAIETGADDDEITATGTNGIVNHGIIDTDDGHDIIIGNAINGDDPALLGGIYTTSIIDTGNDNDTITGTGKISIYNYGSINTGNGEDSILSEGTFINYGRVFLEGGDDSITLQANLYFSDRGLENFNVIETGDGNDEISGSGHVYNEGVIDTGEDNDIISSYNHGDLYNEDTINTGNGDDLIEYGLIYNNGGTIITGNGNDSIYASVGFESEPNGSGSVFLGEGEDYIAGFGNGEFYGGNGNDTLDLTFTSGTYTVEIWGEGGESVIFTKGNQLMITSEFERLRTGNTIYDFRSLTAGQIIIVS
jgi:hypothetical protein